MVEHGDWLTPRFMGRYSFYKLRRCSCGSPAASAKMFGISRFTVRLPLALLCASLPSGMVYLIGARIHSWQAGATAAVLLISSHLWNVHVAAMSPNRRAARRLRHRVWAMYCLFTDPSLQSPACLLGIPPASVARGNPHQDRRGRDSARRFRTLLAPLHPAHAGRPSCAPAPHASRRLRSRPPGTFISSPSITAGSGPNIRPRGPRSSATAADPLNKPLPKRTSFSISSAWP